jgi:hypothetical protein
LRDFSFLCWLQMVWFLAAQQSGHVTVGWLLRVSSNRFLCQHPVSRTAYDHGSLVFNVLWPHASEVVRHWHNATALPVNMEQAGWGSCTPGSKEQGSTQQLHLPCSVGCRPGKAGPGLSLQQQPLPAVLLLAALLRAVSLGVLWAFAGMYARVCWWFPTAWLPESGRSVAWRGCYTLVLESKPVGATTTDCSRPPRV